MIMGAEGSRQQAFIETTSFNLKMLGSQDVLPLSAVRRSVLEDKCKRERTRSRNINIFVERHKWIWRVRLLSPHIFARAFVNPPIL